MKPTFKKNSSQSATNYNSPRVFNLNVEKKDNAVNGLLTEKAGKSRLEIFDLMKILKTF
jgi:hypothetical protein